MIMAQTDTRKDFNLWTKTIGQKERSTVGKSLDLLLKMAAFISVFLF